MKDEKVKMKELPKRIQKSILRAERELDEGKGIPNEEVMKKYSKWVKKSPPAPSKNKQ